MINPVYKFYFQDSCENISVASFTPSDNGGKQAFTITGYTLSDYLDKGDDLAFVYDSNYLVYTIIDITGNQVTMSFDYNSAITNGNTTLQLSIKTECHPYNFNKGRFEWAKDTENYFYRCKFEGEVIFKGADYDYLSNVLNEPCCNVSVKVYKLCDSEYSLVYRSRIANYEGTWDLSKCTFKTALLPNDKYDCILEAGKNEVNIYEADIKEVTYYGDDTHSGFSAYEEILFCEYLIRAVAPSGAGTTYDNGDGLGLFVELQNAGETTDPNTGNSWAVFMRPKNVYVFNNSDINFAAPDPYITPTSPAIGYNLLSQTFIDNKWVCEYRGENTVHTDVNRVMFYNNAAFIPSYQFHRLYDSINDNYIYILNAISTDYTLYFGRYLNDCLPLLPTLCNNINQVVSDFFELNPIGDTFGYVAGENYVTGDTNRVNALLISHITDVLYPSLNPLERAQVLNMSFLDTMKSLNAMFNVYWFIDSDYNLRIEHESWFLNNQIINLTGTSYNDYKKQYSYIKDSIYSREKFTFKYAGNTDFVGSDIVYDEACTPKPLTLTRTSEFITDIHYLRNNPIESFDTDSIVMFATYDESGSDLTIYDIGAISGVQIQNAHLSWANLHAAYHTYGRILPSGLMNFVDTTFDSYKKHRKQDNNVYHGCCIEIPENVGDVVTELGTGRAEKISFDINTNTYQFELKV